MRFMFRDDATGFLKPVIDPRLGEKLPQPQVTLPGLEGGGEWKPSDTAQLRAVQVEPQREYMQEPGNPLLPIHPKLPNPAKS